MAWYIVRLAASLAFFEAASVQASFLFGGSSMLLYEPLAAGAVLFALYETASGGFIPPGDKLLGSGAGISAVSGGKDGIQERLAYEALNCAIEKGIASAALFNAGGSWTLVRKGSADGGLTAVTDIPALPEKTEAGSAEYAKALDTVKAEIDRYLSENQAH